MQRTILLAVTLLALLTRFSWAQTPTAEPAAIPPAPPIATATDSQAIASESDNSAEIPPLLIEEPKADDPRIEEFQQIIQLLVNRNIAKVVPPTDPGNSTESHPTITFTFVPTTNADAIRGVLIDLSLINISNLRVIIRDQSKFYEGLPPTEARILDYESIDRQHVVALWKLFKQRNVNALFSSGKRNLAYGIPPLPDPELGAETTEQIKVETGRAYDAYVALHEVLQKEGPPCSLGYDEKTNSLLVDRRDGVGNEVKKLLIRWQKYYGPTQKSPSTSHVNENSPHANLVPSKTPLTETELLQQEILKFVGRWKLVSASEKNIKINDSDGMEFRRHGDELEATVSQRGVSKSFTVTLTVSDAPECIRRIKLVEKQFNDEPQTAMAVYEISGVEGENDKPLRLKMNLSKRGNYPASLDERGESIHQLELEKIASREGALGLPASAIPGRVWVSSGTFIVAIADDGKSASAYCEQHPTWVAVQLKSTIEAKPLPIVGAKIATIQHGNQCHAYSSHHRAWATLTLPAGEEAAPSVEGFASEAKVRSKTQGEYVFKDEWGKWFSAEEIKAGKVAEHLAALKAKGGQANSPAASVTKIYTIPPEHYQADVADIPTATSVTKIFSLQHSQATDVVDVLNKLYDLSAIKVAQDARKNTVIVSGPSDQLREIEALIQKLDETRSVAPSVSAAPNVIEMEALITDLEGQRTILLQDMGDKHPKVVAIDIQIDLARQKLLPAKKALLLEQMEQALSSLQQAAGIDSPDAKDVESKITPIISEFDQSPDTAQKNGEAFIQQVEEQALAKNEDRMKQLLEMVKAGAVQRSSPTIVEQEQRITELRKRARARALGVGPVSPAASSPKGTGIDAHPTLAHPQQSPPLPNSPADLPQQLAQLRKDYDAAEVEAQRLAEQLRQPGSTASKDELRQTVERAFKLRQSLLRAELSEMLDRLAKTQHSIDQRDRITDQIVTRRVEELLNPQLEWDESKPGTRPETPTAPPKESAPTQPQEWTTKLQGHWRLTQHTYEQVDTSDGKKPQPGDVKRENWNPETYYRKQTTHWKAMFDESRMSICKEDGSDPMTFELTFQKAGPPQQVDLTMEHSPADLAELNQMDEKDRSSNVIPTFKGILEETPDGFRICLDMGRTQTRPFLFVLGPDTSLWEYRRESADNQIMNRQVERDESKSGTQPDTPSATPKESAATHPQEWTNKLQGRWQLTQHAFIPVDTSDGKKPQPGDIKRENWNPETYYRIKKIPLKAILDGNRLSACREDGSNPATFELTFRNAGPPQQVDLTMELSQADLAEIKEKDEELRNATVTPLFKGIIEETPNGFRMCTDPFGTGHRPFLFVAGPDSVLWEFQREAVAPTATAQERDAAEETLPPAEAKAAEKKASPSDTGTAKAGQLTAEQLTLLFIAILERRPTDREEETWLKAIRDGQSVTDVISTLLANNQVFNRVGRDKAEYIKYLHRLLMDRAPTAEELTYWTRRYDELQGIRSDVAREFLGATVGGSEFLSRLAAAPQPLKPVAKEPAAPASEQKPKGTTRKALVASQDIIPGRLLTDKNVVFEEVPLSVLSSVGDDFIQTQEEYEQRSLTEPAGVGTLIRKSKLREKGHFNASHLIPKGMRLNTFPVTDSQTHSGMLKPGDRVDVKVTFTGRKGALQMNTLVENVEVFACEEKTVKGVGGQGVTQARFVSLLVTPEQDGYLEVAKAKGQLSLSLRNPNDVGVDNPNGLNAPALDELRHAIVPVDSPPAITTELEGDWHLLWMDTGEQKMRFAANMSIRGGQCKFSKQKTSSQSQITVDAKARSVHWSNVSNGSLPAEVPPIPAEFKGSYELNGERLTIRSMEGRDVYVWSRGLCDLRAAKSPPDGMALFPVRDVKAPSDLGQFSPGDKVDVSAEWELPDGSRSTGLVAELVEIDGVYYGDPEAGNAVILLGNPDQVKLIEAVGVRAKLTLVARKSGDEVLKLPGGMNAPVLTEIQATAGADPVTPLEGDWYLESQEVNGDVMGHRTNMTIRGDVWSKEFLIGGNYGDTKKLTGLLRVNKQDHSYVISEWPQLGLVQIKGNGARNHVDEKGTFELTDDKLIMKGRELPGNATLTRTWKRGHRRLVPGLSNVSSERKLRWRSGIVEIYQNGLTPHREDDDEGLSDRVGVGVFMAPDGLIVAQVSRGSEFAAKPDSYPLSAKFDDGSQVNLKIVEDAKNGWMTLKPDKEMRVNLFFSIASTPTAVSDEVYQWGIATKGLRRKFDVSVNRILLVDRNVSNVDVPVMQLSTPNDPITSLAGLPVLSADGELLAMTMPNTGDLLLALPASRLKSMFPKSFSTASVPPAGPPVEGEKPAAAPAGEEKPAQVELRG